MPATSAFTSSRTFAATALPSMIWAMAAADYRRFSGA
jgi:hypothetical protein